MKKILTIAFLALLTIVSCKTTSQTQQGMKAGSENVLVSAVILDVADQKPVGAFRIWEGKGSTVVIHATLKDTGEHGFHIHDPQGHYNPKSVPHGLLTDEERHMGDFGNIKGGVYHAIVDRADLDLDGFVGLTINVHEGKDKGSSAQPKGDAGAVVFSGVIVKGLHKDIATLK